VRRVYRLMPLFWFDSETHLIKPGCLAPRLVCISTVSESGKTGLFDRASGLQLMQRVLADKSVIVAGHQVFYDLGVCCAEDPAVFVPLVFKAFDDFRIRDTIVRQQLIDIATGNLKYRLDEETQTYVKTGYTLADLVLRLCNRVLPKEDTWRLKYALLDGVPIIDWPVDAKKYAVDDAVATREVFLKQVELAGNGGVIPTEERATRDAWALALMSMWGVRTDGEAVAKLKAELEAEQVEANAKLQGTGIIKKKPDGSWSRDMKTIYARVSAGYEAQGLPVPVTESGRVSTEYEALVDCKDEGLAILAEAAGGAKLLNTYIPMLEGGTVAPICARFNVLVESNRTSCIAAGTLVEIVRDVKANPKGVPIEDVQPGDLAYGFGGDGKLALGTVTKSGKTGTRKVVRLHWRGRRGRHGHLDLTPEHEVRLSHGAWKRADLLLPGDSVSAMSRDTSAGYARLYTTGNVVISREHRFIFEQVYGWSPEHVHHRAEGNKLDNRLGNLLGQTASEHLSHHGQNAPDSLREKRSVNQKRRWKDNRAEMMEKTVRYGVDSHNWLGLTKEWLEEKLLEHKGRPLSLARSEGIDYATLQKYMRMNGVNFRDIRNRFNANGEPVEETARRTWPVYERDGLNAAVAVSGLGRPKLLQAWKDAGYKIYNHVIEEIEVLHEPVDVYDLTVSGIHSFVANEICVHNCSGPNLQTPPRKGGVRNCFVSRPGTVLCSVDYDTIELRSLAQSCLDLVGQSAMAEALRADEDLHLNLAADFMGISREEAAQRYKDGDAEVADQRQMMKPANFGFPGGMASDSFVDYAKGYGYAIDRGLAKRIHEQWHRAWPEMKSYFTMVSNLVGKAGEGTVISPWSGFVRGGLTFTQLSNHYFQSLTATGAKDALWHVTHACYAEPASALWGSRPVIFMHDEVITEMPEEKSSDAALLQAKIMIDVMAKWIPDIPIKASPVLMRRWHKGAKPVYVNGKLVPSKPVEIEGKVKWVADL
jgi:hypothetical protein